MRPPAAGRETAVASMPELGVWVDELNGELRRLQSVADAATAGSLWGGSLERALGRAVIAAHEDVADAQSEAEKIIASAREQAQAMLASAREQAESILAQALNDANTLAGTARRAVEELAAQTRALEERPPPLTLPPLQP